MQQTNLPQDQANLVLHQDLPFHLLFRRSSDHSAVFWSGPEDRPVSLQRLLVS